MAARIGIVYVILFRDGYKEDLFRTVKSEGVWYENSELESGKALRELVYGGDTDTAVTSGACG